MTNGNPDDDTYLYQEIALNRIINNEDNDEARKEQLGKLIDFLRTKMDDGKIIELLDDLNNNIIDLFFSTKDNKVDQYFVNLYLENAAKNPEESSGFQQANTHLESGTDDEIDLENRKTILACYCNLKKNYKETSINEQIDNAIKNKNLHEALALTIIMKEKKQKINESTIISLASLSEADIHMIDQPLYLKTFKDMVEIRKEAEHSPLVVSTEAVPLPLRILSRARMSLSGILPIPTRINKPTTLEGYLKEKDLKALSVTLEDLKKPKEGMFRNE